MIAAVTFPEGCRVNRERRYIPLAALQQFDWSVFNSWPTVGRTRNMLLFLAFVPRVGMVAQSMRILSHILRRAHNGGRHVLVVVVGEPLNSSGLPVVPTSLQDTGARDVEKLAGSVGCAAGPRRRDFHRSESGHGPGSRSVEMEVAVGAGPLSSGHRRDPMLETRLYH